ncbi:MAG: PRC-barrel domain-containing protein [Desulfobacterales bacterium]
MKLHQKKACKNGKYTILLVFLCIGLFLAAFSAPLSAQNADAEKTAKEKPSNAADQPTILSASDLLGSAVNNPQGEQIAEIEDILFTAQGKIHHIVVATGGFLDIGEKMIALDIGSLEFETQWTYRTIRTPEGTEEKLPWESDRIVVLPGGKEALAAKPSYSPPEEHPRGGASGWGIYSTPAGPKTPEEVELP